MADATIEKAYPSGYLLTYNKTIRKYKKGVPILLKEEGNIKKIYAPEGHFIQVQGFKTKEQAQKYARKHKLKDVS